MSRIDYDEVMVYLMRVYKWEYEYACNLVKTLPTAKLKRLLAETRLQEAQSHYQMSANFAMICAIMVNMQSKSKVRIEDFIGQMPQKQKTKREVIIQAVREQLKLKIPK